MPLFARTTSVVEAPRLDSRQSVTIRYVQRRSKWMIGAVAALVVAVAAAVIPAIVASPAQAIDNGDDIYWKPLDGRTAYLEMIRNVRDRASGGAVYDTILRTNGRVDDYFSVNIDSGSGVAGTRIILRASDLYIQGYYVPATGIYYHLSDATLTDYRPTQIATTVALPYDSQYANVTQNAGESLGSVSINAAGLSSVAQVMQLRDATGAQRARGVLRMAIAISEAARFVPITDGVAAKLNSGSAYTLGDDGVDLVKNWSTLTKDLAKELDNPATPDPAPVAGFTFPTVQSYTAVLALALASALVLS